MKAARGKVVSVHYTLTGDDGSVLDSSQGHEPLVYLHGYDGLLPGLERGLEGLEPGQTSRVDLAVEDAAAVGGEGGADLVPDGVGADAPAGAVEDEEAGGGGRVGGGREARTLKPGELGHGAAAQWHVGRDGEALDQEGGLAAGRLEAAADARHPLRVLGLRLVARIERELLVDRRLRHEGLPSQSFTGSKWTGACATPRVGTSW